MEAIIYHAQACLLDVAEYSRYIKDFPLYVYYEGLWVEQWFILGQHMPANCIHYNNWKIRDDEMMDMLGRSFYI